MKPSALTATEAFSKMHKSGLLNLNLSPVLEMHTTYFALDNNIYIIIIIKVNDTIKS